MFERVTAGVRLRLRALFHRRQLDRDLDDELAFHLAMRAEKLGSADEARRQFGNTTWFHESCRELWNLGRIEIWWQDLRYGLRTLRRTPVFTTVAVLSLALGIGANIAIFSLLNAMLLKSLPVRDPQELRVVNWTATDHKLNNFSGSMDRSKSGLTVSGSFSYPIYEAFRDRASGFASLAAFAPVFSTPVIAGGQSSISAGVIVSGNFFDCLGVAPLLGRTITPADDQPIATPVAVITYAWWEQRFGLDPTVLGRQATINGAPFTIVGVLPRNFLGPLAGAPNDFFVPLSSQPQVRPRYPLRSVKHWWLQMMGRLTPGVDERQVSAALNVQFLQLLKSVATGQKMTRPAIALEDGRRGPSMSQRFFARPMTILMTVVGVILLIACTNLASLLLARGAARRHEMAVRVSVGAGRPRLLRQLFTESLLLAGVGGGLGLLLALWVKAPMVAFLWPTDTPLRFDLSTDAHVLLFSVAVSMVTALLFGLVPAFRATRFDPAAGLRGVIGQRVPRLRLGKILVSLQVALSLLLLVGAGLFIRTLVNLRHVDAGFNTDHLLVFRLDASGTERKGREMAAFYERAAQVVAATPGVRAATLSNPLLLSGSLSGRGFTIPGHSSKPDEMPQANYAIVGDSFLATMGMPLLLGRDLNETDNEAGVKSMVVNETFARTYFPEGAAGKSVRLGKSDVQIVGVSRDAKYDSLRKDAAPTMYLPYRQCAESLGEMYFEVRTDIPPLALVPSIRRAITAIDRRVPLSQVTTQAAAIDRLLTQERMFSLLCGFFAVLALLLCCIGLYGVMAYTVSRRTAEMGIRTALGARPDELTWLVWREALLLAACGVAVGVPAAVAATRVLKSVVFGIRTDDPATFAGAIAILLLMAALAAWVPAHRVARLDPMSALRRD